MPDNNVAIIFGGRSPEHEVSVTTAHQVIGALSKKYEVVPIYVTKAGEWLTGDKLLELETFTKGSLPDGDSFDQVSIALKSPGEFLVRKGWLQRRKSLPVDVVFPAIHGAHGEDGTLQGLLELMNIPYVGAGVVGSAVGMDKIIMKAVLGENNLPLMPYLWFTKNEWENDSEGVIKKIEETLAYPLFIKPGGSGSSIGVGRAKNKEDLKFALDVAGHYDLRLLVEEGLEDAIEINCSVMGNYDLMASVCEQPISGGEFLSFDDKYLHEESETSGMAGADRKIPAPISAGLTTKIQELAKRTFRVLDCRGVARVDFLVGKNEKTFVNEINTIPGSFSFYLWKHNEINFPQLVDKLIELAFEVHEEKNKITYSYPSNLLKQLNLDSIKMKKG